MLGSEVRIFVDQFSGRRANDQNIQYHRLLRLTDQRKSSPLSLRWCIRVPAGWLQAYDPGNQPHEVGVCRRSQRGGLLENLAPDFRREVSGRKQVDRHAE
jgi:hypothetical protein